LVAIVFAMTQANGFSCMEDYPAITLQEEMVAPFSLPQEALTFQPPELALISQFAGGDQERKIHCNIEQRADEFDRLKSLQDEATKLQRTYYRSITVMATRYISYARGNATKAIAMMDETQGWRKEFFGSGPLLDADMADDFSHGIMYFTGRDFAMRPILVIRAERVPAQWHADGTGVTKLIRMLIFQMEYLKRYMFVPGKIENLVVLVDLKNLGIADVPIKALKSIYSVLSHHYIVRVFKFYIVNMSYMLGTLVGVIKPILTDRQRQKLNFLKNVSEIDCAALHHMEEDLGGTRPKITKFFPFPLLPGPFEAGSKAGARPNAVQNCHRAFTPEGFEGFLWDPSKSKEENTRPSYTDAAEDIFVQCGLPVPAGCPVKAKEPEPIVEPVKPKAPEAPAKAKIIVSLDDFVCPGDEKGAPEAAKPEPAPAPAPAPAPVVEEKAPAPAPPAPAAPAPEATKEEEKPTPKKCCVVM